MSSGKPTDRDLAGDTLALVLAGGNGTRLGELTRWQCKPAIAQRSRYTLVLAGDHIYKMDYRKLIRQHADSGAEVTVACVPVSIEQASSFGVLGVDPDYRVRNFIEKPAPGTIAGPRDTVLASMGVYVFTTRYLAECLRADALNDESAHDFGRDILPTAVREGRVGAHAFTDDLGEPAYWRDVGTLEAYWQAHMELLVPEPPIDLYDPAWPILTAAEALPPARLLFDSARHGFVANSLLAGGVVIRGAQVTQSVLSQRVEIAEGSSVDEAVILPGARIGRHCWLQRVIVDAGVEVPEGTVAGVPSSSVVLLTHHSLDNAADTENLRSVA